MKVLVTVEVQFEVEVRDVYTTEQAVRVVEANWDTIYKHSARWKNGVAPQLQHGRVVDVRAEVM